MVPNVQSGKDRCVRNQLEVVAELRLTGLFSTVQVIADFKKRNDSNARDDQFRQLLNIVKETDILIGVHGAGMAHIHYLEPKRTVVELLDNFYFDSRITEGRPMIIYQTMARMQGCGYVAADIRGANSSSSGYVIPPSLVKHLASVALAAWNQTQTHEIDECCHYQPKLPVHCPMSACKGSKGAPLNLIVRLRDTTKDVKGAWAWSGGYKSRG